MPQKASVGKCPYCPMYHFMSEADKNRHLTVLYHDKKDDGNAIWTTEFKCSFVDKTNSGSTKCNLTFKTRNQLAEHRKQSGHLIRKRKSTADSTTQLKQLRIERNSVFQLMIRIMIMTHPDPMMRRMIYATFVLRKNLDMMLVMLWRKTKTMWLGFNAMVPNAADGII